LTSLAWGTELAALPAEHDGAVADLQLRMHDTTARGAGTETFSETEGVAEPVDRTTDVLVDQDWHHRGPWGGSIDDHTHLSDVAIWPADWV
jgi:hypothetical protein